MNVISEHNTFKQESNIYKLYDDRYTTNIIEERKLMKKSERKNTITEKDYRAKLTEKSKIIAKDIDGLDTSVINFDFARKIIPNITTRDPTILACAMFLNSTSENDVDINTDLLDYLSEAAAGDLNANIEKVKFDILRYYRVLYEIGN